METYLVLFVIENICLGRSPEITVTINTKYEILERLRQIFDLTLLQVSEAFENGKYEMTEECGDRIHMQYVPLNGGSKIEISYGKE